MLLHRSRRPHHRSELRCAAPTQRADPALVERCAVSRGRRGTRRAAISCGATSPTIAAALDRDNGRVQRLPHAVQQQQRQHLRLPGPPALGEHLTRRVVRYELEPARRRCWPRRSRARSSIAQRRRAHPDGSYCLPIPPYGGQLYEGTPDVAGGPSNLDGKINPRLGQPPCSAPWPSVSYRPTAIASIPAADSIWWSPRAGARSHGLCFSPDYKTLYVASTGKGPGDTDRAARVRSFLTVGTTKGLQPQAFSDCDRNISADRRAVRCDGSAMSGPPATPAARRLQRRHGLEPRSKLIGRIRLPEVCGKTSASADPKRTACSWRRASRSMACIGRAGRGTGVTRRSPQRGIRAGEVSRRADGGVMGDSIGVAMNPSDPFVPPPHFVGGCLSLVFSDHLRGRTRRRRGRAELRAGRGVAQKIPALVEFDIDRRQSSALGVGHLALGVELLLLGHQPLDVIGTLLSVVCRAIVTSGGLARATSARSATPCSRSRSAAARARWPLRNRAQCVPGAWLPDQRVDSLDADAPSADEGRLRRFLEVRRSTTRSSAVTAQGQ